MICLLLMAIFSPVLLQAQIIGPVIPSGSNPIAQNSVSNMRAFGDSLWIGPRMQLNIAGSNDWLRPEGADSVINGRGRMFSIAMAPDTIVAGIGYNLETNGSSVQSGMGFYMSIDAGRSWRFSPFPLDPCRREAELGECETLRIPYGQGEVTALPVIVQQQSPPYDVTFSGNTIFFAAWASGVKRSTDFGETWERVVLPPMRLSELNPNVAYDFHINPRPPARDDPNPTDYLNFTAFSVFVDRDGNVWAGTAGGINISDNALTAPIRETRWRHISRDGSSAGLIGNWITRIKQDPATGHVWFNNWIGGTQGEAYGIVSTGNLGETFEQHLRGEKIYDIAFDGNRIYAAGDNGLFVSPDAGRTWEQITYIQSANTRLKDGTVFYAVSKAGENIWVGTSDGLASTSDHGKTWNIVRVNMEPGKGNAFQQEVPDVETYAYPTPFSSRQHTEVRIVFDVKNAGSVRVRIYDFGMNLVRELDQQTLQTGIHEAAWDGKDAFGRNVANGPYFYHVEMNGANVNGKMLVLE